LWIQTQEFFRLMSIFSHGTVWSKTCFALPFILYVAWRVPWFWILDCYNSLTFYSVFPLCSGKSCLFVCLTKWIVLYYWIFFVCRHITVLMFIVKLSTLSQKRGMISLLIMKRKSIHPMEWKVSFQRMNAFYISLLTMKSYIAFGTVYRGRCLVSGGEQLGSRQQQYVWLDKCRQQAWWGLPQLPD
jgi:hypothetical protein